jgi:hypothetical protein
MDAFDLLYTCRNQLCTALYCRVCIEQWLNTYSCPKVCASCKSTTVLTISQNTTSVPADLTITLTRVENITLNTIESRIVPASNIRFQPTSHPKVIAVQFILHFLTNFVFICRLRITVVIPKASTALFVIYCVFVGLHLLLLVAIRTQYYQRRYLLALLAVAATVGLLLYRFGIIATVLPLFEVPMMCILSTLAFIVDVVTCWTSIC